MIHILMKLSIIGCPYQELVTPISYANRQVNVHLEQKSNSINFFYVVVETI